MSNARDAEVATRRARAIQLRNDGKPWQAIADELGYSDKAAAHKDVTRAMEQAVADLRESAEVMRQRELERLDELTEAALGVLRRRHVLVSGGKVVRDIEIAENELGEVSIVGATEPLTDDGPTLAAVDRLVKIQESRRRLLGLDAPQRVETSGTIRYEIEGVDHGDLT